MNRVSVLLGLALVPASLSAQLIPTQPDPTAAWAAFQARHGAGAFQAAFNQATGTPEAVYGQGLRVAPAVADMTQARALAAAVLDQHAELLGRGASQFVPGIEQKVRRLYIMVYDQRFAGLEVIGGRADVRLNENGVVAMFGSRAVPIPGNFVIEPRTPMATAIAAAHAHLGLMIPAVAAVRADLVIHAEVEATVRTAPRLAWRVQVDQRDGQVVVGKVFVDAQTGVVFKFDNEVYQCWAGHTHVSGEATGHAAAPTADAPRGHIGREIARKRAGALASGNGAPAAGPGLIGTVNAWMNMGDPLTPRTNQPVQGVRVVAAGVGSAFTDANGNFSIPYAGTTPVTLSVDFAAGNSEYVNGGVQALQGTAVSTSVQASPGVPAAVQLLAANPAEFDWSQTTTFWHTDDVHRWVRGITGPISTSRINIANVRATVNRASTCNAFYTGNTINFYATGGTCNMTAYNSVVYHEWGHGADDAFGGISQTDGLSEGWGDILSILRLGDPIVGRNFTTSGGIVRDARNTFTYPAGGGVHQQGQTWMGFTWDLRTRLIARLGNTAGAALTADIVVGTLPANATNQPNAVREVFLLDDDDANLNNGTPNCADILAAAQGRRIPTPITSCSANPGAWTVFGTGCPGSGVQSGVCGSLNSAGGTLTTGTFLNEYAYGATAAAAGTLVGFELFTRSNTGNPETVEVRVYRAATPGGTVPSQTAVATGSITVGTTLAFYPATLTTSVPFAAGENLWIAQRESTRILRATITAGTAQSLPTVFRATSGGTTWSTSGAQFPAWRWTCPGGPGARPVVTASGLPQIGTNFPINLRQAAANAPALLSLGASNTSWLSLALPFDLTPVGGTNCFVYASVDVTLPVTTNGSGEAAWPLALPAAVNLVGSRIYSQALVFDSANVLGIVTSSAGTMLIGQP